MRLSMWMIVNRLHNFELDVHIRDQSPIQLKSARRVYATNCVYVYQSGKDSVCKSGDDYFVIKDIDAQEAVEIVQSVFDYYDDWEIIIREAITKMDFQKVVDKSWHIFHNPIVLMDGNWHVVALSNRYGENDLDEEWKHICRYGSVSIDVYSYFKNDRVNNYETEGAHYYRMNNRLITNCISSLILYDHTICGRINILEKSRKLNPGDIQMLNYLVQILSLAMALLEQKKQYNLFSSIYHNLLEEMEIDEEQLCRQMSYRGWINEKDLFYILVVKPVCELDDKHEALLFKNQLARLLPECEFDVINQNIVIISHEKCKTDHILKIVSDLDKNGKFVLGKSLKFQDMRLCRHFYNQALFAIQYAKTPVKNGSIVHFYDYAIDFLILNNDKKEAMLACHPDVLKLFLLDKEQGTDRLRTLQVYLDKERSLIAASQELYVHRNTLVYRVNKILEMLTDDIEDAYTRDYMKLSIRVFEVYNYLNHRKEQ